MSAELAHQNEGTHFYVALRYKVRIRLHPSMALQARICAECCHVKKITIEAIWRYYAITG